MNTAEMPPLETRVRLFKDAGRKEDSNLLAYAELVIAKAFVITGIKVLMSKPKEDKPGSPFVAFPSRRCSGTAQDKYFEVAHPITAEARVAVRDLVMAAYEEEFKKANA